MTTITKMLHRLAEEVTPDGVRRIRLARTTSHGILLAGKPVARIETRYLDGSVLAVLDDGVTQEEPTVIGFEAMPARTQDVLDLGRLSMATQVLARQMGEQAASGARPSPAQIKVWVDSYRGLVEWKREAERRMAQAQGQIDAVGTVLAQFL